VAIAPKKTFTTNALSGKNGVWQSPTNAPDAGEQIFILHSDNGLPESAVYMEIRQKW